MARFEHIREIIYTTARNRMNLYLNNKYNVDIDKITDDVVNLTNKKLLEFDTLNSRIVIDTIMDCFKIVEDTHIKYRDISIVEYGM